MEAAAAGAAAIGIASTSTASAAEPSTEPSQPRLPLTILLREALTPQHLEQLRAISPQITVLERDASSDLGRADVVFGSVRATELPNAKRLRWVQCGSAGREH